ncbi:amidohydrolase family protein [Anditalea andensis]|uniref:Hydrolase n=1 Tax=Anditalea andensis TaxID=1048983 RepID=A0A074LDV9_9BACT|nr:amidohydrolase family protein [Anditalea andensis]KEO71977.1 hydrolase [Anditalea andensis]
MIRPFIDAHVHLNTPSIEKMITAVEQGAYFLSINTDIPFFIPLDHQRENILRLSNIYPDRVKFITSFSLDDWGRPEWPDRAINQIRIGMEAGAVGVKFWKNIGMELKDINGQFVMLDHPSFDPIFEYIETNNILVLGHLGEPKNCWLPLHEMTVESDRNYFQLHPQYHMYLHPEYPSYQEQLVARDNRLSKHPHLKFIGLHLASLEWSVSEVARWLDTYPLAKVDLAERICHLQYQAQQNRDTVRTFLIDYQDRVIYGTDIIDDGHYAPDAVAEKFKILWEFHWQFFAGKEVMQAPEFSGKFIGLDLPEAVLSKIFYKNAATAYGFDPTCAQL